MIDDDASGATGAIEDDIQRWIEPLFRSWWEGLDASGRGLLKRGTAGPIAVSALEEADRIRYRGLADMGFLVEEGDHFRLLGRAWMNFVRHAS